MARPYKGDRQTVTSKIPRSTAHRLGNVQQVTSETTTDLIARLLEEYVNKAETELEMQQEALPIPKAS